VATGKKGEGRPTGNLAHEYYQRNLSITYQKGLGEADIHMLGVADYLPKPFS